MKKFSLVILSALIATQLVFSATTKAVELKPTVSDSKSGENHKDANINTTVQVPQSYYDQYNLSINQAPKPQPKQNIFQKSWNKTKDISSAAWDKTKNFGIKVIDSVKNNAEVIAYSAANISVIAGSFVNQTQIPVLTAMILGLLLEMIANFIEDGLDKTVFKNRFSDKDNYLSWLKITYYDGLGALTTGGLALIQKFKVLLPVVNGIITTLLYTWNQYIAGESVSIGEALLVAAAGALTSGAVDSFIANKRGGQVKLLRSIAKPDAVRDLQKNSIKASIGKVTEKVVQNTYGKLKELF